MRILAEGKAEYLTVDPDGFRAYVREHKQRALTPKLMSAREAVVAVRRRRRLPRLRLQLLPARPLDPHPRGHPPAEARPLALRQVHLRRRRPARRRRLRLEGRLRLLLARRHHRQRRPRRPRAGLRVQQRRHDAAPAGRRDGPAVPARALVRRHRRLRALRREARRGPVHRQADHRRPRASTPTSR